MDPFVGPISLSKSQMKQEYGCRSNYLSQADANLIQNWQRQETLNGTVKGVFKKSTRMAAQENTGNNHIGIKNNA